MGKHGLDLYDPGQGRVSRACECGFHEMRGFSWLSEDMLAFQEGLRSVELVREAVLCWVCCLDVRDLKGLQNAGERSSWKRQLRGSRREECGLVYRKQITKQCKFWLRNASFDWCSEMYNVWWELKISDSHYRYPKGQLTVVCYCANFSFV